MTTAAWIRVDPDEAKRPGLAQVRGVDISVRISPYDVPRAFRGFYVRDRGIFRIEFKYVDEESAEPHRMEGPDDCISFEVGQYSRKLLALEVAVDQFKLDMVRLDVRKLLDHADAAVKRLQKSVARPSAKLNYSAVDEVLRENRENPQLLAAAES